jgi:predicted amidohydrolase YtcJ
MTRKSLPAPLLALLLVLLAGRLRSQNATSNSLTSGSSQNLLYGMQSSPRTTALRSYTGWAARQLFLEGRIGSIESGKDADIAVWDRDLYSIATDDIKNLRCEMTIFNGKIVFQTPSTPITVKVAH